MGMDIDSLEIAIQAEASNATRQIDNLYNKLGTLSKALTGTAGGYRKMATEVGRVTAAVRAFTNLKAPNLDITKMFNSVDTDKLSQVADSYQRLFGSIQSAQAAVGNDTAINKVVNSIGRLTKINLSGFDINKLRDITAAISGLSQMGDVSGSIAKLVSALARLSNVGGNTVSTTAQHVPALGNAVKEAFDKISSAHVDEVTQRLLTAFTRLATAGKKAEESGQKLPSVTAAVKDFFDEMSRAPEISDTTLRMVEAFAKLATSGKTVRNVGVNVSQSYSSMSTSGKLASTAIDVLAAAAKASIASLKTLMATLRMLGSAAKIAVTALGKISNACLQVGASVMNPVGAIKKIGTAFQSAANKIGISTPQINKATFSLKNLIQTALGFYGLRSAFNWGKQAIELASDLTEVQNVVENSFGSNGIALVERYAKSANESLGMTELTFKEVSSRFQAMGNALGLTTGQIAEANAQMSDRMTEDYRAVGDGMGNMAIRLTKLAADIASFYNVEQKEAAEALNAIYTGQTRALRRYGLDLTQATLQEYAHKQGISKKVEEMTQAEKTLLRYQYVLAQTSNIQGDFARTADTWANQIRILKQNLQALASVVGGTLINAFKPLITWLNRSISSIIAFFETIGNALGKIFGWKIVHTPASNAADEYDTLADSLNDYTDAANGAADANNNLAGSTGGSSSGSQGSSSSSSGKDDLSIDVVKDEDIEDVDKLDESFTDLIQTIDGADGAGGDWAIGFIDGVTTLDDAADEATASVDGLLASEEELANSLGDTGSSGADAAEAIENTQKAVEDYKNTILGFDELNVLNDVNESISKDFDSIGKNASDLASGINDLDFDTEIVDDKDSGSSNKDKDKNKSSSSSSPSSSGGSGGSGGAGGTGAGSEIDGKGAEFMLTQSDSWVEYYKSSIDSLFELGSYIGKTLSEAMESIDWQSIYEKARGFGTGLASFLNGLISPRLFGNIGGTIANAINTVLNSAEAFVDRFNFSNLGNSIASGVNRFFENYDFGLHARVFYKSINGIADTIKAAADHTEWGSIGGKISECVRQSLNGIDWVGTVYPAMSSFGSGIAEFLNGLIQPSTFLSIGTTIANAVNTALHFLDDFGSTFDFDNFGNSMAAAIRGFFANWDAKLTARTFSRFANGIVETLGSAISGVGWGDVGNKISECVSMALSGINWNTVYSTAGSFGEGLANFLNGLLKPSTFWKIGETVAGVLNTAMHVLDNFGSKFDFKNFGDSVANAIKGFFAGWDAGLSADTFNKLASGILTSIGSALDGVNWKFIGSKIRHFLVHIEWGELLGQVGDTIVKAINSALDLAVGLFDGTPLVGALTTLKDKFNGIAAKMDLPKLANGISKIVDALTPAVSGFAQGFIDVLGKLGELGASAIKKIGEGLQVVADALNSVDPTILESVGNFLGKIAGGLLGIMLADKGVTTVGNLIGMLTGTGIVAGIGGTATEIGNAATAIGNAGTNAGGAVGPVSGFIKTIIANADPVGLTAGAMLMFAQSIDTARFHAAGGEGPITDFYQAVEGMRGVLSDDLVDKLQGLAIEFANNGIEGEDAAKKLAEFFTNEKIDPSTIELALASVSESLGDANPFIDTIRQSFSLMGEDAIEAGRKVSMTDEDYSNLRIAVADLAAEYGLSLDDQELFYKSLYQSKLSSSTAEQAYKTVRDELVRLYGDTDEGKAKVEAFDKAVQDHIPGAFGSIESGADKADQKSGTLKTNLFAFAGAMGVQALAVGLMGIAFNGMGSSADGAKKPVGGLKDKVNEFVKKIASWGTDALKNSKELGGNVPKGMEQGIDGGAQKLLETMKNDMYTNPLNVIKAGWGIHSPSDVAYGLGENIMSGLINAISSRGKDMVTAFDSAFATMQSSISSHYSEFRTSGESIATQFHNGLISVNFYDVSTSWYNALGMNGLNNDMWTIGYNAATSLRNGMKSVSMPRLSYYISAWNAHDLGDGNTSYTPVYTPQWYAKGGFPNLGELFVANENGIEMMGRMGQRNVVANNMQITEGIRAAVVDGMMEVFMATNHQENEKPIVVNAVLKTENDEVLARAVERGMARREQRFNTVGYSY